MISEPGRYIEEYLDAGCDSITIHVEIDEPIEPTLRAIRAAGRAAGLAVRPGTPLDGARAVRGPDRHRDDHDRRAGLRRSDVHARRAARQDRPRRATLLRHKLVGGEVHVDGGINRETAEYRRCARGRHPRRRLGAVRQGPRHGARDPPHQGARRRGLPVRTERRRAADPARQDGPSSRRLPKHLAQRFMDEIEATAGSRSSCCAATARSIPTACATTTCSCPATVEVDRPTSATTRTGSDACWREAAAWRAVVPERRRMREGAAAAGDVGPRSRVDGATVGEIGAGLLILLGVGARRRRRRRGRAGATRGRTAHLPRRRGPDEPLAARRRRRRAGRLAVHAVRGHAAGATAGVHGRGRRRSSRSALRGVRRRRCGGSAWRWRPDGSVPRWRSRWSTTGRSRSGSTPRIADRRRGDPGARGQRRVDTGMP